MINNKHLKSAFKFISIESLLLLLFPANATNIVFFLLFGVVLTLMQSDNTIKGINICMLFVSVLINTLLLKVFYVRYCNTNISVVSSIANIFSFSYGSLIKIVALFLCLSSLFYVYSMCIFIIKALSMIKFNLVITDLFHDFAENHRRYLYNSLFVLFVSVFIGISVLLVSFMIPVEKMHDNARESAKYISSETAYQHLFTWCRSRLDNATDSLVLMETVDDTNDNLINRAILVYSGKKNGDTGFNAFVEKYVHNNDYDSKITYARYWHGILALLKPLMLFFNYREIRILNGITQTLLNMFFIYLLYQNNLKKYILPYIISLLMIMPIVLAYSIQFSTCFYVMILSSIVLLLIKKNQKYSWMIFLLSGILTSYIDFLTYPIATFGVPMVICLLKEKEITVEEKIAAIIRNGIFWTFGYVMMWSGKWVLANILTSQDVIIDSVRNIIARTSTTVGQGEKTFSIFEVIAKNISEFFDTPFKYLASIFTLLCLYRNRNIENKETTLYKLSPFLIISLLPVLWYAFASNHSYIHTYFTNKGLIVSMFSMLIIAMGI